MEVEFRPSPEDYRNFYRYHAFRRNIGIKIAIIALFSFWIGGGFVGRPFSWPRYLIDSLIFGCILLLAVTCIPYLVALIRSRRRLEQLERSALSWRIELTADGFLAQPFAENEPEYEKRFWRWESIKYTGVTKRYIFIVMTHGMVYAIPKSSFQSAEDPDQFVYILEAGKERIYGSRQARAKKLYLWGLLGLIPNVGLVSGFILLFRGIFQFRDKLLILIGASGILFTPLFWWIFTSALSNSGTFKTLNVQMARAELNTIFRYVEVYKIDHGDYPDSLEELDLQKDNISIYDPIQTWGPNHKGALFFYQKVGKKYWLFSVGLDGKPFTSDDIFPVMNPADTAKFGLMIK